MRATVHFLNVGWGDAHLIRHPSGALTLMDGGDGTIAPDRDHPLHWMNREGVSRLDWMILTHIHEDHLNGLLAIARHLEVKHAVLPYEIPSLNLGIEAFAHAPASSNANRVLGMLEGYTELIRLLREQGTDIQWRADYDTADRSVIWEEEGCALTHLYPWRKDPLPGLETLRLAAINEGRPVDERMQMLDAFFGRSNDDSSVYRLACHAQSNKGILFGGDQLTAGWERISQRTDLKSRIWKVPHHGLADSFQGWLLSRIQPEACVIPICQARSEPLHKHWDELRAHADTAIQLTGEVPMGARVRLADEPIEVWIGG